MFRFLFLCFLLSASLHAQSPYAKQIVDLIAVNDFNGAIDTFDKWETVLEASKDPIAEGHEFLQDLVVEINAHYGSNLTLSEICLFLRQNVHLFGFPPKEQAEFLATLTLLEIGPSAKPT